MNIAYLRVSTVDQNQDRQRAGLEPYKIDRWYEEKVSGKNRNRPQLKAMIDYAREGDTVYVWEFSRLARSTSDLLAIVSELNTKGVKVVSVKEDFDTATTVGKFMMTMLAALAEMERANLLERQREGIAEAKKKGKYKGRKPVEIDRKVFGQQYDRYMRREITKTELAKILKISRPTLDKLIVKYGKQK